MSIEYAASHAVEAMYSDHRHWLVGWLRGRTGCSQQANDLAQDAFMRVIVRSHEIDRIREPRAWLTTIAHGLVIDQMRRQTLERAYAQALATLPEREMPSPEAQLIVMQALARVDALLDGLHPRARAAFLLSRLEGLAYAQIADRLGCCLSSVEKYMATAVRHCIAARN